MKNTLLFLVTKNKVVANHTTNTKKNTLSMYYKKLVCLCVIITGSFTIGNKAQAQQVDFTDFSKHEKITISNMLAFNFFMNFQLSVNEEDLSIIYDYLPTFQNDSNVKEVNIKANFDNIKTDCYFYYNDKNKLEKITYHNSNSILNYTFEYDKNVLTTIKVKNKKKYVFVYSKKLLTKVLFYHNETVKVIFYLNYQHKNATILEHKNVELGKIDKHISGIKKYIKWNNAFKLTQFELDKFKTENITYNSFGDIKSFPVDRLDLGTKIIEWEYTYDDKNNWTNRTYETLSISRKITYAK